MVERFTISYPLADGCEDRLAYVYLPTGYDEDDETCYPVLYMFDGHNVFFDEDATYGKSWGLGDYLDATETPLIVAAIECNHSPDNGRLREYSPFDFDDPHIGFVEGHGKDTMEWMVNVFKPMIDENYRTLSDRDHTFIAGSSMGGLMSFYALLEYNEIFSRAAALSPSLWTNPLELEALIKRSEVHPLSTLYMDYGSREIKFHKQMRKVFTKLTGLLLKKKVCVQSRIIPGGNHSEASWERQLPFVIPVLMYEIEQ